MGVVAKGRGGLVASQGQREERLLQHTDTSRRLEADGGAVGKGAVH